MIERKKNGITDLCESGKGKYISGAADFGAAAQRSHGFHTRPLETHLENFSKETLAKFFTNEII